MDLHKLWNAAKKVDPVLAWWGENSKCVYQEAFRDLDRALKDFIRSKKGERRGKRLGFPKFKKRGKCRDSFRFNAGALRCTGNTVTLPRLGIIRTHVAGMQKWRLACAISDQGFGMALRMLVYKTGRHGGQLILADRFYPSSKTCSGCGYVKAKLALPERTFIYEACGLIIDRDQNAARNLLDLGTASGAETGLAEANACGAAVRPGNAGLAALNQEPGTATVGQTGTVTGQLVAAEMVLTRAH
ncbi:MAG: zinc ribbon domain-containing protein [Streptosporangiaceae bacterium]